MAFTANDVAKLRELTGAGMMACKKALEATDGDMNKAAEYLREQGVNVAAKKASRIASEGVVCAHIYNGNTGVLAEVNCESDFVAKSDVFIDLCNKITAAAAKACPADLDALQNAKTEGGTVADLVNAATAKIGEKISLRRFQIIQSKGLVEDYIHLGGKMGVLLELESDADIANNAQLRNAAHDIAMHIAAFSPSYVNKEQVPVEIVEHEKAIFAAQLKNDPAHSKKPPQVIEKIVEGKINKFYSENCLLYQEYAKDSSVTVEGFIKNTSAALNVKFSVKRFIIFVMGEGLEKKQDNLADEVAKLSKA